MKKKIKILLTGMFITCTTAFAQTNSYQNGNTTPPKQDGNGKMQQKPSGMQNKQDTTRYVPTDSMRNSGMGQDSSRMYGGEDAFHNSKGNYSKSKKDTIF